MKSLKTIINERLKLNKQSEIMDNIEIDITNKCMMSDEDKKQIIDFANSLPIKPKMISNKYKSATNDLNVFYDTLRLYYNDGYDNISTLTISHIVDSTYRIYIRANDKPLFGATEQTIEELIFLTKEALNRHKFFDKIQEGGK